MQNHRSGWNPRMRRADWRSSPLIWRKSVGGAVGQGAVGLGPDIFSGIEFRGIGGELFDVESGMEGDPLLHCAAAMDRAPIPQQDNRAPQVPKQVLEEGADIQSREIAGAQREREGQPFSLGRDGQRTDRGDPMLLGDVAYDGGTALRRPRAGYGGDEQEARFIEEDQMGATSLSVFYMRPPGMFPLRARPVVPLMSPAFGFLATPSQPAQQPPDMVGVVANARLLPDHLRDPLQGPQVGPMTGGQGPGHQTRGQPAFLFRGLSAVIR